MVETRIEDTLGLIYRHSSVKIPPTKKYFKYYYPSYFSPLFHATHNNPGYRKNRAKVYSSFENKLDLNTRHEGCTFSANNVSILLVIIVLDYSVLLL